MIPIIKNYLGKVKLGENIDERFGLPGNVGRDFGEKFVWDFIEPGTFAELWTALESTHPNLQPLLQSTFEKTNELLRYIKPEKGDEAYRVSKLGEAPAQELSNLLDDAIKATEETNNLEDTPDENTSEEIIQYFDNIFEDMLMIFTSNTASDEPLEPYKQTKIGFGSPQYTKEQIREVIKREIKSLKDSH